MDSNRQITREIIIVALGEIICTAAMLGVFALLHRFSFDVLWGGLLGAGLSIANFFLTAVGVNAAANKAEKQDVRGGQRTIRLSMLGRYLLLIVVLAAAMISGWFQPIALLLPLLFVRPILSVGEFFRKSGETKA